MDLDFTEEQQMLRESLRSLCEAESDSRVVRRAEQEPAAAMRGIWHSLAGAGFLGLGIAERYGGSALGMIGTAIAAEELGRALVPVPYFESAFFAARLIAEAGSEEQRRRWLPALADGTLVIVPAWYEAGSRDDIATIGLTPARGAGGVSLSGRKMFVAYAGVAQRLLVLLRHPERPDAHMLACVDAAAPGIAMTAQPNLARAPLCAVDFADARVGREDLIGHESGVGPVWSRVFIEGLIPLAAQAAGGAREVLDRSIAYAREREQFGRPIGAFQAIAHYLADAATEVEAACVLVWQAAWAHAEGEPWERLAITAKLFACRAFRRVSALAIQVHGGLGFTSEADPQLYFRRAKHQQLFYGESGWLEAQLARRVLAGDMPVLN